MSLHFLRKFFPGLLSWRYFYLLLLITIHSSLVLITVLVRVGVSVRVSACLSRASASAGASAMASSPEEEEEGGNEWDDIQDDDSDATIDSLVEESQHDIQRKLSRGKSFNNEARSSSQLDLLHTMSAPDVDEELHDLNIALGNGNEDFDFRHLSNEEFVKTIRGEPMTETFSNVGNMMKFAYPEIKRHTDQDSVTASQALKKSMVCNCV